MRILITLLIFFSIPLLPQSYLNVHFLDGTNQNTSLNTLTKILFDQNNDQTIFYSSDLGSITRNLSAIHGLTFDDISSGGLLPVELSKFSANVNQNIVSLLWSTATEVNNFGFDIQRCRSESGWTKIGFVKGFGNSNSNKSYSYSDRPEGDFKFLYRLKQIDNNGKYSYSSIVTANIGIPAIYELKQNFPNPFNPSTKIVYKLPINGNISLIVYDVMGRAVVTLVNENKNSGSYEVDFNGSGLSTGVYFCKMSSRNFVNSIKMLFIK
jgi:hypothetical protein